MVSGKKYKSSIQGRFSCYKTVAKQRGKSFSLSIEEFSRYWDKPCWYCGSEKKGIGLDRIENNQGYNPENIVSCCRMCNVAKNNFSQEEFFDLCRKVYNKHLKIVEVQNGTLQRL